MFKVNNKDTLTTLIASYFTPCSIVSVVDFEHVIPGWERIFFTVFKRYIFHEALSKIVWREKNFNTKENEPHIGVPH